MSLFEERPSREASGTALGPCSFSAFLLHVASCLVSKRMVGGTKQRACICPVCLLAQGNSFRYSFHRAKTSQKGRDVNAVFWFAKCYLQRFAVLLLTCKTLSPICRSGIVLVVAFCCDRPAAGWMHSGKAVLFTRCFLPLTVRLLPCQREAIDGSVGDVQWCCSAVCSPG